MDSKQQKVVCQKHKICSEDIFVPDMMVMKTFVTVRLFYVTFLFILPIMW